MSQPIGNFRAPTYDPNPPALQQQQQSQPIASADDFNMASQDDLDNLMNPGQQFPNNQADLVDDILSELDTGMDLNQNFNNQQNMNSNAINHMMDGPTMMPMQQNPQAQSILQGEPTHPTHIGQENFLQASLNSVNKLDLNESKGATSLLMKLINQLKLTGVVFIIIIILSIPQFNSALFSLMPSLILENGQLSIYAIALRALLGAALFYVIQLFI